MSPFVNRNASNVRDAWGLRPRPRPSTPNPRPQTLQGYLAYKKTPTPLGPPQDPRHRPTAGSLGGAFSYERGTPVSPTGVTRSQRHTPPLGWSYAPRTSPTAGPYGGACPQLRVTPVIPKPDWGADDDGGEEEDHESVIPTPQMPNPEPSALNPQPSTLDSET